MSISMAAAGRLRSKDVMTSGWSTPSRPIRLPLTLTSAHRPGKNVESREREGRGERERERGRGRGRGRGREREREREREGEGEREEEEEEEGEGEGEREREREYCSHYTLPLLLFYKL